MVPKNSGKLGKKHWICSAGRHMHNIFSYFKSLLMRLSALHIGKNELNTHTNSVVIKSQFIVENLQFFYITYVFQKYWYPKSMLLTGMLHAF